jgi:serine/threonine-protein kinase
LVFARSGELLAAPFDIASLEVIGPPVAVLDGVSTDRTNGYAGFALSRDGTLVFEPGGLDPDRRLAWVDRNGNEEPVTEQVAGFYQLDLSPDGRHLAITIGWTTHELWVYDLTRDSRRRLTFGVDTHDPVWSTDGSRIVLGGRALYWKLADGSGGTERLLDTEFGAEPTSWSPDGQILLYTLHHPDTQHDIWVLPAGGEATPFLVEPFDQRGARFSPDGKWVAYQSSESGSFQIYVTRYPGAGARWQISTDGGTEPIWSADGSELFYRSGDEFTVASVSATPEFRVGRPASLFNKPLWSYAGRRSYDVHPDGERFILELDERAAPAPTHVVVVLNWFEDLKRLTAEAQ